MNKERPAPVPRRGRPQAANRPEHVDKLPRRALFSTAGPTGWRRRRDISTHKGTDMKEGDFSDQHHKFTEEES